MQSYLPVKVSASVPGGATAVGEFAFSDRLHADPRCQEGSRERAGLHRQGGVDLWRFRRRPRTRGVGLGARPPPGPTRLRVRDRRLHRGRDQAPQGGDRHCRRSICPRRDIVGGDRGGSDPRQLHLLELKTARRQRQPTSEHSHHRDRRVTCERCVRGSPSPPRSPTQSASPATW